MSGAKFGPRVDTCSRFSLLSLSLLFTLASLYIDNTKPICYNSVKKNGHVVLISVSEVFIMANCKNGNKSFNGALGTLGGLF